MDRTGQWPSALLTDVGGQELTVVQPQDVVEVRAGATLILGCSVTGTTLPGPVKWFLGEGPARKLVYAEIGSFERVLRTDKASNTNFSIAIQNVTLEDAGTYYCVKQKKDLGGDKDVKTGPGTRVAVNHISLTLFHMIPQGKTQHRPLLDCGVRHL
ncbi:Tyrosine-protein phosphatase non-receptor type substrate 1 [Varanus komodoensis]|nr:Tyrosine-protein phosphatase non-receptor type substrate 1 [Varanus komodoensis]